MDFKTMISSLRKKMLTEVNEGHFYVVNNKNRAALEDGDEIAFTDDIGNDNVKSWSTRAGAEKYLENFDKELIESDNIRVVNESEVCSYGYFVNADNEITPVYTLNTLLNRATNERYHKNIMDAQFFVDDSPNREKRKQAKKVSSAIERIKKQAEKLGITPEQLLKGSK